MERSKSRAREEMVHTTAGRTVGMLRLRANERQRLNILFRNPHYLAKEVKKLERNLKELVT